MWHLIGRFRCSKCEAVRETSQRALRSPVRRHLGVCRDCLTKWERTGRRCGRCWSRVQPAVDMGLLLERGVFAHVDCGAAALVA
jgi:predicted amidophosphoribosyltransferase